MYLQLSSLRRQAHVGRIVEKKPAVCLALAIKRLNGFDTPRSVWLGRQERRQRPIRQALWPPAIIQTPFLAAD
jgi:hypothetical protein